jgi:hypothetical protein
MRQGWLIVLASNASALLQRLNLLEAPSPRRKCSRSVCECHACPSQRGDRPLMRLSSIISSAKLKIESILAAAVDRGGLCARHETKCKNH